MYPVVYTTISRTVAAKARGKRFGRKPGYRPKSDRLSPEVMRMVEESYSQRKKIAKELKLSKTTVNEIVKRHRHKARQPELTGP